MTMVCDAMSASRTVCYDHLMWPTIKIIYIMSYVYIYHITTIDSDNQSPLALYPCLPTAVCGARKAHYLYQPSTTYMNGDKSNSAGSLSYCVGTCNADVGCVGFLFGKRRCYFKNSLVGGSAPSPSFDAYVKC